MTHSDVDALVELASAAAEALFSGDARRYAELVNHADDYTLMPPGGGEPIRGFDSSEESLAAMAAYFQGGTAEVELVQVYASGDLVVLVLIERHHGRVGGLPRQAYDLRVTCVFRCDHGVWRLVHRHADPLAHHISADVMARLARGAAA
jgi:ketosteroid isomerase-like protein